MGNNQEWISPVSFYFQVEFLDMSDADNPKVMRVSFQEVSGLRLERQLVSLKKGGANENMQSVPNELSHGNIVLKRALMPWDEEFSQWLRECMAMANKITPRDMNISLLDAGQQVVACWSCTNTYPVKWEMSGFDAMKSELVTETLEMAFEQLNRSY